MALWSGDLSTKLTHRTLKHVGQLFLDKMSSSWRVSAILYLHHQQTPTTSEDLQIHRQDSRGTLAGTSNSSMGLPRGIDPSTHRTMIESSYPGAIIHALQK